MNATMDINTLARMMADGFSSMQTYMDGRFDALEKCFSGVEGRIDGLEGRMDGLEGQMEKLGLELRGVTQRMETLEGEVRLTNQHIDHVVMPMVDTQAHRIKKLELKTS